MMIIKTREGEEIIVDDDDFAELSKSIWHLSRGYARRYMRNESGERVALLMHRQIMGLSNADARIEVDHINGNKLDNRRQNLRVCTHAENQRNRGALSNNKCGYKGVHQRRDTNKFEAQIKYMGRIKKLGCFDNPELAHEMYCLAADMLHGSFSRHA